MAAGTKEGESKEDKEKEHPKTGIQLTGLVIGKATDVLLAILNGGFSWPVALAVTVGFGVPESIRMYRLPEAELKAATPGDKLLKLLGDSSVTAGVIVLLVLLVAGLALTLFFVIKTYQKRLAAAGDREAELLKVHAEQHGHERQTSSDPEAAAKAAMANAEQVNGEVAGSSETSQDVQSNVPKGKKRRRRAKAQKQAKV